jgi:hypothetical protein
MLFFIFNFSMLSVELGDVVQHKGICRNLVFLLFNKGVRNIVAFGCSVCQVYAVLFKGTQFSFNISKR